MNGSVFLDTNILVYLYSTSEAQKRNTSISIIKSYNCITSTQALNEFSNVFIKKYKMQNDSIKTCITNISKPCLVQLVAESTISKALDLNSRYDYSYYDCLMLASALENNCEILFSEDMSGGQIIENKLKIINPYKECFTST